MRNVVAAFAKNTVFANIILSMIFLAGGMAAFMMIRESFPQFSLDYITIEVPYPGADPEEIEEGISRKVEEAIEGMEGIKRYTTYSSENIGTTLIEVQENYDTNEVLDRIRSKVGSISTFPVDAEEPIITEMLVKNLVCTLGLSGNMPEKRLKEWAEDIKDEIQFLPEVSQVEVFGVRQYEIGIEVSEEKLREYGLTFSDVAEAVRNSNLNMAGGTIRTKGEEIRVRTVGRKYTGEELSKIVVLASPKGDVITLDKIAYINDGFEEDPIKLTLNDKPAVALTIFKTPEEDDLAIADAIDKFIEKKNGELPEGLRIEKLLDITDLLKDRINLLTKNGVIGLCLVFLILWLFLDIRLSFWVGMGMPISIAGAMAILWSMGETTNMISLFGLIMVLGIIVDDAIVVGEAIFVHRKIGKPPLRAAVDGVCEVGMPVIAAVTTTIVAFLPLAYIGGIMGKFIKILPIVVIACLAISLVECLIILPAHLSHLPDPNIKPKTRNPFKRRIDALHRLTSRGMEWFVEHMYAPFLGKVLYWRYISLCVAISVMLITIGLFKGGILKYEVFADIDGFVMTANVEFPNGTPPEVTYDAIRKIEEALDRLSARTKTISGDPLVLNRYSSVGQTLRDIPDYGPNVGSVQAILLDSELRGVHSDTLMAEWEKEIGKLPGIKSLTFEGLAAGPPGADIEVWLQGNNLDNIIAAGDELMEKLGDYDGVYQIQSDFSPGKNEIRLELKPEARTLGLTVSDLARQVNAGYYGDEALRLQRGRDDIRIKVRYTSNERSQLSDFEKIRIRTKDGHEVPLYSVANVYFSPGYSTITRTDGMRRVAISAAVNKSIANSNEIFAELNQKFFPNLKARYSGLYVSFQGEQENMRESFDSLKVGFPLALLGIFIIIATIFRSYLQPVIIMFTVPFGIIGAIIGHLIFGYNISLMTIFGMVALAGVVVNDAIILIERFNENLAEGMSFIESIRNAGARRFRAVFLTTVTTVGGLTPLILEKNLQARFLIPMALAIAAGVAFATVLTLVIIPNLLVILNDFRCVVHRIRKGNWPTREEVEPARDRKVDLMADSTTEKSPATILN